MSVDLLRKVLFWCAVINYGILSVWFLFLLVAHDWMYALHAQWFRFSVEQFDMLHYAAMAVFKLGILLLNVAPWTALHIVRRAA